MLTIVCIIQITGDVTMIDFYTWKTPNGIKVAIMLEEVNLPYQVHAIDITKQEQFNPEYLKINPNNKIPAIVDHEGPENKPLTLFESGAILIYLAEKTRKLLPVDSHLRMKAIQWLMFQMGGLGPMLGQLNFFLHAADEKIALAINRYQNEAKRLYQVMDQHLSQNHYFAKEYSIADIAIFPWVNKYERHEIDMDQYPHVKRWYLSIANRPAVQKGLILIK